MDLDTLHKHLTNMRAIERRDLIYSGNAPKSGMYPAMKDPSGVVVAWDPARLLVNTGARRGMFEISTRPDMDKTWLLMTLTKTVIDACVAPSLAQAVAVLVERHPGKTIGHEVTCALAAPAAALAASIDLIQDTTERAASFALRSKRAELDLSTRGLVAYLKDRGVTVSTGTLSNLERADKLPSAELAARLRAALDLPRALDSRDRGRQFTRGSFVTTAAAVRRAGISHPVASRTQSAAPVLVTKDRGSWGLCLWDGEQWSQVNSRLGIMSADVARLWKETTGAS